MNKSKLRKTYFGAFFESNNSTGNPLDFAESVLP
jgi:hypothetical protein